MSTDTGLVLADDLAQVADQEQVLEVGRHGGQVLQRLDGLLAALDVAGAQRGGQDLLQQRRLTIGAGAERAQVAPADAVARQLGDGADDLALGLVVVLGPGAVLALDDAVVLELGDQARLGTRVLDDVVERVQRAAAGDRHAGPSPRARRIGDRLGRRRGDGRLAAVQAPGRQLLADHAQRQELVALHAQDRAQARDVGLRVQPVAARRAPGLQQLLVLQVADLGDRDVRELLPERLAHGADGHRLGWAFLGRCGAVLFHGGHQRERNVSLYLPTWSSSPSAR